MPATSRIRSLHKSSQKIASQLSSLAEMAKDEELLKTRDPSVSKWSIGEQVEHLRRSDLTILGALASLPQDGPREGSPSPIGRLVLLLGFIPRGKGRAPGATKPLEVDFEDLGDKIEAVGDRFATFEPEFERLGRCRATIRHPALGHFTASQMLAFAAIHHHHHLKIITDIRRAVERKRG